VPLAVILSLCAAGVTATTPATLYFFWLHYLHRRGCSTVVSGRGDFLALLAGLSGFLLVGLILTVVMITTWWQAGGRIWDTSTFSAVRDNLGTGAWAWLGTTLGLASLLGVLAWRGLRRRRMQLSIYHATEKDADLALAEVCEKLGLSAMRTGQLWSDGRGLFEVTPFYAGRHLTITILAADPRLAEELLREIRSAFDGRAAGDSPLASWLLTAAASSLVTAFCFVGLIFVGVLSR
jgi:hypothetical protein